MSDDQWLDKRREGIGGSDAGAYGCERLRQPAYRLPPEKTARPKRPDKQGSQTPEHPFMLANINGLLFADTPSAIRGQTIAGMGGHEIKSAKTPLPG
jgi:hypothetical protein